MSPKYAGRHHRVSRARGRARDHACVDCGQQAYEWSQTHGTTGLAPEDYKPRCVPCHRAYDGADTNGELNGHVVLTAARIRGIRASVGASQRELARLHRVGQTTVRDILLGRTWKNVK